MHSQMEYLNPWGTKLSWDQKASVIIDPNCHEKQRNYKLVPINHVKRKYVNKYWTWRWGKQQIRLERFKTMRRMEMLLAAIIAILLVLLVSLGCFSWEWYLITRQWGLYSRQWNPFKGEFPESSGRINRCNWYQLLHQGWRMQRGTKGGRKSGRQSEWSHLAFIAGSAT